MCISVSGRTSLYLIGECSEPPSGLHGVGSVYICMVRPIGYHIFLNVSTQTSVHVYTRVLNVCIFLVYIYIILLALWGERE